MEEIRKIALVTTAAVVALIILSTVFLTLNLTSLQVPTPPILSISSNVAEQDAKAKEISNYKELVLSMQSRAVNIFDNAVLKTLLPLFNSLIVTVLSYVFTKTALQLYSHNLTEKTKKS